MTQRAIKTGVRFSDIELSVIKPRENLPPSIWAEKYIHLGAYAEEKGPFRLRRTPHAGPILDAFVNPVIEEIVFCKPAQIAGTTILLIAASFFTHQQPCPIGIVLADEDTSKFVAKSRFAVLYDDSPDLEKIKSDTWTGGEYKTKTGAYITFLWASSVMKLGTKSLRVMMLDEIDKAGWLVKSKEASALSLAGERKETFFRFKLFKTSTPTLETGNINKELESCDVIYDWHVPCPFCGQKQPLRWSKKYASEFKNGRYRDENGKYRNVGSVVWQGGLNATDGQIDAGGYKCGSCRRVWTTAQKNEAVENGKMVSRKRDDGKGRKVGFHINRIYSLLGKSGDIPKLIRAFIKAVKSGDPKNLQGFVNSTLADVWKETINKTESSEVLKARCDLEPLTVPGAAVALTCGIDVQKWGFWFTTWAWTSTGTSWLIDYGFLGQWVDLEFLLFEKRYPIEGKGQTAGIWRAGIDTGGGKVYENMASQTEQTYNFLRKFSNRSAPRVFGTKGSSGPLAGYVKIGQPIDRTPSGKVLKRGIQLVFIDTDKVKDAIHYRFGQARIHGEKAAYLHRETDETFARHIAAEEKRIDERGVPVWVEVGNDNHLLDCTVIAHACAEPDFYGGVRVLGGPTSTPAPEPSPAPRRPRQPSGGGSRW